jgi:UDP-N-acetylglucosamine 2-epimerase (non-hydrolysing)/GDP/UDP-N,N'-diacetylbacillosamine 2-epimerase (hydrolysing)
LLSALDRFPEAALLFTKANADSGGRAINQRIEVYVAAHGERAVLAASLGQALYLTALKEAAVVIGNSSSGIIEAPAAGTATVNLGIRQKGRLRAASIIDCDERSDAIEQAIRHAMDANMRSVMAADSPPYGKPRDSAGAMARVIRTVDLSGILRKSFLDLDFSCETFLGTQA